MTEPTWDPAQYNRFADHRGRPFADLTARVACSSPERVVDLGCGPGTLTAGLAGRWPDADVLGVDSSAEMIASAAPLSSGPTAGRLRFVQQDLRDWVAAAEPGSVDMIVSNATLQWVPDQLDLMPGLVVALAPGGWLAIQIPGNHDAPVHRLLRELARSEPYAESAADASGRFSLPDPDDYLDRLSGLGCTVDAWETTYSQVLAGDDAVWEWIRGTGARPVLQALESRSPHLLQQFTDEYRGQLREAYPPRPYGTVLPFRRVFAVAHRPA